MGQRRSGLAVGFAVVVAALCLGGLGVLGGTVSWVALPPRPLLGQSQTQSPSPSRRDHPRHRHPPPPTDLPPAFSWVGGLALSAENPRLGGVSGLEVGLVPSGVERGVRLLAVTDNGDLLTGDLVLDWTDELRLEGLAGNSLQLYPIRDRQTDLPARQAGPDSAGASRWASCGTGSA